MTESVLVFAVMASSSLLLLAWQRRPVLRLVLRLLRWRRDRVSAATNARAGVAIGQRLTQLTPTRVVKQQDPTVAVIEAEKTRRAAAIASMTELFDVPRLVGGTPTLGRIEFERIVGVEPMWSWLVGCRRETGCAMAERAGESLAVIHETLRLPVGLGESLAEPWRVEPGAVVDVSMTQDHEVALHGDFNAWNLLVVDGGRRLVITDWAGSDLCSPSVVRGRWVFDAAWLIITLFRSRLGPIERIGHAEAFSRAFLASYARARRLPEAPAVCGRYLASLAPVLSRPVIRGRRGQWLRPKLDVARLGRFAAELCGRTARRRAA